MWDVLTALGEVFSLLWGAIGEPLVAAGRFVVLEGWETVLKALKNIFTPFTKGRINYVYVLSSLGIALTIYVLWARRKNKTLSLRGAFQFIFPKHIWQHPFAWLDLRYFFVARLATMFIVVPIGLYLGVLTFFWAHQAFSTLIPSPLFPSISFNVFSLSLIMILFAMISDFLSFLMHRLQHRTPFLWEFHKVHHSALAMHPLSNYREHFVDNLLYFPTLQVVFSALTAFITVLLGYHPTLPTILGVGVATFLFNFMAYNLRHSHIWFAYKPYWLGYLFISPAHHQLHHSKEARHIDKNFGFMFSLWDWAFGTLYLPREREKFRIGLSDNSEYDYNTIWRILWVPFAKAFKFVPQNLETPLKAQHPAQ